MKKPELKDFDYDGADMADWYKGYSEALENYTEHLESTNKQLIEALVEVQESQVMSNGLMFISNQTKDKVKIALRDAGVEEL